MLCGVFCWGDCGAMSQLWGERENKKKLAYYRKKSQQERLLYRRFFDTKLKTITILSDRIHMDMPIVGRNYTVHVINLLRRAATGRKRPGTKKTHARLGGLSTLLFAITHSYSVANRRSRSSTKGRTDLPREVALSPSREALFYLLRIYNRSPCPPAPEYTDFFRLHELPVYS